MLVLLRPVNALPGFRFQRFDEDQPARFVQGRSKVLRAVRTQIAERHLLGDRHPFATDIWLLDDRGFALDHHLALAAGFIDCKEDALVLLNEAGPLRALAGDQVIRRRP